MKKLITFMFMSLSFSAFSEEFNNFCTTSLSEGNFHVTNCSVNEKVDGKTYCFGNKVAKDIFLENPQEVIKKAEQFYKASFNDERKKITQEEVDNILNNEPDCDLSNLDVGYLNFSGKDLTHCKMVNISFFGADLRGANLKNTNLNRTELIQADLTGTDLTGTDLTGADLNDAEVNNANFKDVVGLNKVKNWNKTVGKCSNCQSNI
ncbi:pentapeptide repeat-containing protein [Methylophilaceae bacterium]|nr:pentapeptide repeat-containing protein [Methylophilaceae bacterium]